MVGTYCLKWKVWLSTNLYFKFVTRIWHHMERRSHWTEVSKIGITGINSNKLSLYTFSVSSLTRNCNNGWVWARWSHWHGEEKSQIRMEVGLRLDFVHNLLIFHLPIYPWCSFWLEEARQEEKNGGKPKKSTRSAPDGEERLLPPLLVPDERN